MPASSKEFLDIQANYKVQIHSETRTWHDNNSQSKNFFIQLSYYFEDIFSKQKCGFRKGYISPKVKLIKTEPLVNFQELYSKLGSLDHKLLSKI